SYSFVRRPYQQVIAFYGAIGCLAADRPKTAVLWPAMYHLHHRLVTSVRRQKTGQSSIRISSLLYRLGFVPGTHASTDARDHNEVDQEVSHEQISIRLCRRRRGAATIAFQARQQQTQDYVKSCCE